MKQDRRLVSCCKKKLHKGQGAFSRTVDYIALRAMAFMLCYLWFAANISNTVAQVLLALASTAFISVSLDLIHSLRLDRIIKNEREKAAKAEFDRRLALLPDSRRMEMIKQYMAANTDRLTKGALICTLSRSSGVSAEDVLKAVRSCIERGATAAVVFHCGSVSPEAKSAAASYPEVAFEFIPISSVLSADDKAQMTPTREEVDFSIIAADELEKKKRKAAMSSPFSAGRSRRYIWAAACLTVLSFFVAYPLYYRLMAAVCACFGATAWWINRAAA